MFLLFQGAYYFIWIHVRHVNNEEEWNRYYRSNGKRYGRFIVEAEIKGSRGKGYYRR